MAGTSGNVFTRAVAVTPSARRLPALMCGSDDGMASNMTWTSPAISAVSAAGVLRYAT